MVSLSSPLKSSSQVLRSLLLLYWLAASALLTTCLVGLDLLERQRQLSSDAERSSHLIASMLATGIGLEWQQSLIQSYILANRDNHSETVNLLLVMNESGQIVLSSRPNWRYLMITDPLLSQAETDDADFRAVVQCFRRNEGDCLQLSSAPIPLHLGSTTVLRPVQKPSDDIGKSREKFLVIMNYDRAVFRADLMQTWLAHLVLALLIAGLLCLGLWLALSFQLLPQLTTAAQTDGLTQLMSRGMFMELAKDLLAEAEERQGELVFAILDIDHFKRINDSYGHSCGDAALSHVAEIFRAVIRSDDLLCRLGGEEFAMLLSLSRESGNKALERLRLQLEMSRLSYAGHQLTISASIGAVATADCGYNIDYLYTSADQALYTAKRNGRNRLEWNQGRVLSRLAT